MRLAQFLTLAATGSALALAASSPAAQTSSLAAPGFEPRPSESPAPLGSAQPNLTVSDRGVLLSWVERAGSRATLKFAERSATGWSAPRVVASGDDWFVNWADVPSVVRLPDGTLAAHWLQKSGPGTYAYDVRLSHSKDDGRTWAASFLPHHDGTKTEHGFASLFALPAGGLGLVWLDGRAMAPGAHGAAGDAHAEGAMSLRFASFDGRWSQTADMAIDTRVCECCPTTAAVTADGVIVAYRDRSETEIRDIAVSRLESGRWTTPVPVHRDDWQINACPVNGPMLAARGRDVALAWFTGQNGQPRVSIAFSADAGRTFSAPVRLDDAGTLGRVDVALLPDGSALASWVEHAGGIAELRVRRIDRTGTRSAPATVARMNATRASGYPRMAVHGREVVFAWTDPGTAAQAQGATGPRVLTAVAPVPR